MLVLTPAVAGQCSLRPGIITPEHSAATIKLEILVLHVLQSGLCFFSQSCDKSCRHNREILPRLQICLTEPSLRREPFSVLSAVSVRPSLKDGLLQRTVLETCPLKQTSRLRSDHWARPPVPSHRQTGGISLGGDGSSIMNCFIPHVLQ